MKVRVVSAWGFGEREVVEFFQTTTVFLSDGPGRPAQAFQLHDGRNMLGVPGIHQDDLYGLRLAAAKAMIAKAKADERKAKREAKKKMHQGG